MNTVKCDVKSRRVDFNDLINFILNKYGIDGITLTVYEDDRSVDRLSTSNLKLIAFLTNPMDKSYVLFVRKGELTADILCHEMIHLWQYDRGDLKMLENGRRYIWKGSTYDSKTQYDDREWEKEAFSGMYRLYREYRKSKKIKK